MPCGGAAPVFVVHSGRGLPGRLGSFAAISAVVTVALTGALQAVDGVALKAAADAWLNAPAAEQPTRLAAVEAVRWLEWGVRSYQRCMLGVSLLLFAVLLVRTAPIPMAIGYLAGLTGLAYLGQAFVVGSEGFSPNGTAVSLLALALEPVWIIWLFVVASRKAVLAPGSPAAAPTG